MTYAYPPLYAFAGPPAKVKGISEALAARGHEVTVVTSRESPTFQSSYSRVGEVDVHFLACPLRYRSSFTINPGAFRVAKREVPISDVVHIFGTHDMMGPAVARQSTRAKVPYVFEPLGMFQSIGRSKIKKNLYMRSVGMKMVVAASRVIATSQVEAAQLVREGVPGGSIVIRRNGVDVDAFKDPRMGYLRRRLGLTSSSFIILFMGRLTLVKQPQLLLKAFHWIHRKSPQARLVFVGPDEDHAMDGLIAEANERGISDVVHFAGALYGTEKVSALADADLFVLPSSSESFGNAAAEALAASTPVVVTDTCGIAPFVVNRAGLVVPATVDSIATAIDRMIDEPLLRERFAANARSLSEELSWDEPVSQMEAIYARVREEKGR